MKRLLIALFCLLAGCSSVEKVIAFKSITITRNYQWEEEADTWKKYYITFNFYLFPPTSYRLISQKIDIEQEDRIFKIQQMNKWLEGEDEIYKP